MVIVGVGVKFCVGVGVFVGVGEGFGPVIFNTNVWSVPEK
jgi:hypothetical protein